MPEVTFADLIAVDEWQKIQNRFSELIDICMQTVNPDGSVISSPSMLPRFCREVEKNTRLYNQTCALCLPDFLGGQAHADKNLSYCCEAGLFHFMAPLKLNERVLAYIILGPVILVRRKEKEEYRPVAERFGIEPDSFWDRILEIKVITHQYMQAVSELLKDSGAFMLKYAYEAFEKKTLISGRSNLKPQKFLDDLLNLARTMSQADTGSIMLFDAERRKLTIKASYGIPDEIVRSSELLRGEGIAGFVAEEKEARLIGEKETDKRIRAQMKRPYLGHSMVLPLCAHDTVVGVMNLSLLKTSPESFNQPLLDQIKNLLELTSEQF